MQLAQRVSSLAQEHNDAALSLGACRALAATLFHLGDFDAARQHAVEGLQIWRAGGAQSYVEELHSPAIVCLCYLALSEWHLGEISASHRTMTEAIVLAKELDDLYGLANALFWAAVLAQMGREVLEAERLASELIELAIRQNFGKRRAPGEILREWARSLRGANRTESIFCIEGGIRAIGFTLVMPYYLALKAEALYLEGRFFEALKAISDAEAMAERFEEHWWCAELHRLRGVFLTAMGADSAAIDASFQAAINTAKQQKSTSLAQRAQVTLAEYHREKIKVRSSRAFQLPLS
jgi:tetratricopeptide (TPR) repeat protein